MKARVFVWNSRLPTYSTSILRYEDANNIYAVYKHELHQLQNKTGFSPIEMTDKTGALEHSEYATVTLPDALWAQICILKMSDSNAAKMLL